MIEKLVAGIAQFKTRAYPERRPLFRQLAEGQKPPFLFITCSDSRINPNLITGADAGELFTLRNIGNIVPPHGWGQTEAEAVVEYAVVALGVRHIIVCGHSNCGAMKALLQPEQLQAVPTVAAWMTHAEETRTRVQQKYAHLSGKELLDATIRENVLVQLERVRGLPCVAPRADAGSLELHGWVYEIGEGDVYAYNPAAEEFRLLYDGPPGREGRA